MARESGFGEHLADFGRDWNDAYIAPKRGVLDRMMGAAMIAFSAVLEGPDHIYDAMLGTKYEAPSGIAGHTRRDLRRLFENVVALRPLRAAGDAWKLLTSDVPLDAGDLITGSRM